MAGATCPIGQNQRAYKKFHLLTQIWFLIFRHKSLGEKKIYCISISTVTSSGQVLKWLPQKDIPLLRQKEQKNIYKTNTFKHRNRDQIKEQLKRSWLTARLPGRAATGQGLQGEDRGGKSTLGITATFVPFFGNTEQARPGVYCLGVLLPGLGTARQLPSH